MHTLARASRPKWPLRIVSEEIADTVVEEVSSVRSAARYSCCPKRFAS
jgi:hypothetical protein